jgi:hypothetical protein
MNLSPEKISAILSAVVAMTVLVASFFQWWDITYSGGMIAKTWVKVLFAICIIMLIVAILLLLF